MRLLVTGGAGFIGSNFIRHILSARPDSVVINFDRLTYAGNLENLREEEKNPRYRFVRGDVCDASQLRFVQSEGLDAIVNFAAESHVDRSILDAAVFVKTNVLGAQTLLEAARRAKVPRFVQVSTDEVYGSLGPQGQFTEESPLSPNSPYAASKAAADLLIRSYHQTYGLDVVITRCGNNYGPRQFPEKLIPLMILNALENRRLPVYGDGLQARDWIHVKDHCRALEAVLLGGEPGGIYNIGANQERRNLDVVKLILRILGRPEDLIEHVRDRPGHDRRYALETAKIEKQLGWKAAVKFEEGLKETVAWYRENQDWVARVRSGAYRDYYGRMYERRDQTLAGL